MIPGVDPEQWALVAPALTLYAEEVHTLNRRFGLVAAADLGDPTGQRFFHRHILDSLLPWQEVRALLRESGRRAIYDLGSGAGLPGVPLGLLLARDISETVLVERRSKRVTFLMGLLPRLSPPVSDAVIRVLEADAQTLRDHPDARPREALVVFRAYQQTSESLLAGLARTFGPDTPVCAWKGQHHQAEEELSLLKSSPFARGAEIHRLVAPVAGPRENPPERSLLTWYTSGSE